MTRLVTFFLLPSLAFAASSITGSVRNQTAGVPAAGNEVILLRLLDGMQEETRTRTDAQGNFAFNVQLPQSRYLVRVMHQGVNYDREAPVGGAVTMDVFDVASRVKNVSGKIEIIRIGSVGNSLHVSDMYDIKNDSTPPVTQASERSFEFYLPPQATISSIMAAGPGSGGVKVSAAPVRNQPGHYTLNFPLRPGETKFAVNYDLPYNGHAVLRPRLFYPVEQLAVMLPPSMTFHSQSPSFHPIVSEKDFAVEAASQVQAGEVPAFEISGNGAPPPMNARGRAPGQIQSQTGLRAPSVVTRPPAPAVVASSPAASNRRPTLDAKAASSQARSLLFPVVVSVVLLAGAGLVVWSRRPQTNLTGTVAPESGPARSTVLLEAVKEELFQLEKEKARGSISREEYATAKRALDVAVERAMAKAAAQKS